MDTERQDRIIFQTPQQLAGASYNHLIRTKEGALDYLGAADERVRLAAVLVCISHWKCLDDPTLAAACRGIITSRATDGLRLCAITCLGRILSASKEPDVSRLLANTVRDRANSIRMRKCAYWALREIQYGAADENFDTFYSGTVSLVKEIIDAYPEHFSKDTIERKLVSNHNFPEGFWNSTDEIDWGLVNRCAFGE